MPWIRDHWPSTDAILEIAGSVKGYKSFIIIELGWENATVIAARWSNDADGHAHLQAVRVAMDIANVLLTLLDTGKISGFAEALGEATMEEFKIDFYKDRLVEKLKRKTYEPPSFLELGAEQVLDRDCVFASTYCRTYWDYERESSKKRHQAEHQNICQTHRLQSTIGKGMNHPEVIYVNYMTGCVLHAGEVVSYLRSPLVPSEEVGIIWETEAVIVADGSLGGDKGSWSNNMEPQTSYLQADISQISACHVQLSDRDEVVLVVESSARFRLATSTT